MLYESTTETLSEEKIISGLLMIYDNDYFEVKSIEIKDLSIKEIIKRYERFIRTYSLILKIEESYYEYNKDDKIFYKIKHK